MHLSLYPRQFGNGNLWKNSIVTDYFTCLIANCNPCDKLIEAVRFDIFQFPFKMSTQFMIIMAYMNIVHIPWHPTKVNTLLYIHFISIIVYEILVFISYISSRKSFLSIINKKKKICSNISKLIMTEADLNTMSITSFTFPC